MAQVPVLVQDALVLNGGYYERSTGDCVGFIQGRGM